MKNIKKMKEIEFRRFVIPHIEGDWKTKKVKINGKEISINDENNIKFSWGYFNKGCSLLSFHILESLFGEVTAIKYRTNFVDVFLSKLEKSNFSFCIDVSSMIEEIDRNNRR
ncbi:MAG: hypothetical protein OQK32_07455 [Gammaproteobacteria bacterium]|nr:hypothetical protein [Gammaproteobacteria bacterium]MCW8922558.1 hypothetical protein [Gammaproteobacteria bacterium]